MSPRRKVFLIAAVPLGLAAIVFGLACLSPVQTWIARRVLSAQSGMQAEVRQVSIGWSSVHVSDLTITKPGVTLRLPSAEVDLPLLAAVRGRVDLRRLVAKHWTIELSNVAPSSGEPVRKPAGGFDLQADLFSHLELPVDLELGEIVLEGELLLPEGRAEVVLNRSVVPSRPAAKSDPGILLNIAFTPKPSAGLPVKTMTLAGELNLRQSAPNRFSAVEGELSLEARGDQFPDGRASINAQFRLADSGGKAKQAYLHLQAAERRLLDLSLEASNGENVAGTWAIDLRDADLVPFMLGQVLPDFVVTGTGKVSSDVSGLRPAVSGDIQIQLDRLEDIAGATAGVGPINLTTRFDISKLGNRLRIRELSLTVAQDAPVITMQALQEFSVDTQSGELSEEQAGNDLVAIAISDLPMKWVQPLVPDFKLQGGAWSGEWRVTKNEDLVSVRPVQALTASRVDLDQAGVAILQMVDLSIAAGGSHGPAGWQADLLELWVSREGRSLIKLNGKAECAAAADSVIKLTGTYESDLRAILAQPWAPPALSVTSGWIRGEVSGVISETREIEATLGISDLRTTGVQALPGVALAVRATQDATGRIEMEVPLSVTGTTARRSDLLLSAVVNPTREPMHLSAQLNSSVLYLEDLQALSAVMASEAETEATGPRPAEPKSAPDMKPFWSGLSGEVTLAVQRLVYAPGIESADITGSVKIGPEGLSLEYLRALIGAHGKLQASGLLTHDAAKAKPYAIDGNLMINNFDPGPFFQVITPGQPSMLEGRFDLTAKVAGRAEEPRALIDQGLGQIELTGADGTLRALGVKLTNVASLATPAAALLGLVGAATGNQTALKYSAATDVVRQLAAVKFDQINLRVTRDDAHNVVIKNLSLDSPWLRLAGAGEIQHRPELSVFGQPLSIDLQLLAKGRLADGLNLLKLLGPEADAEGYLPLVEKIKLDGSLENIGAAQLQRLIERALR